MKIYEYLVKVEDHNRTESNLNNIIWTKGEAVKQGSVWLWPAIQPSPWKGRPYIILTLAEWEKKESLKEENSTSTLVVHGIYDPGDSSGQKLKEGLAKAFVVFTIYLLGGGQ